MRKLLIIAILGLVLTDNVVAQFPTKTNLSSLSISANTREKPQSKVWMHDGKHWSVLSNSSGAHVWRLDGTTWTKVLTISSSSNLRADCKVVGNIVHVFLFRGNSSDLVSIEYDPANSTYKLWTGRTSTVRVTTDTNAETATIDIDSNGRMWVAYDNSSNILVRWSDSPYSSWSAPITVASGINADDIGAVIALPMFNKIGVLWSNQNTEFFGFKLHTDGANPSTWSSDESPASQSALNVGAGFSDDHLNMKVASDGTLYCAVKTSYDTPGYTKISLLVRRPNGTWDNIYKVSELGTRGIVILNEVAGKIRVIYTETEDGGDIYYRESAFSPISFGQQFTLISGTYNNATSIKSNYTSQAVILASTSSSAVGVLVSDGGGTPPPLPGIPTLASPANTATGISIAPTLSWNAATNATSYQLQMATSNTFSSPLVADINNITTLNTIISGLAYSTEHFWRVRAVNVTGESNWSTVRSFTTEAAPVPIPGTPTLASPANNTTGTAINLTLSWNAASNATSYQLQVATTNNFTTPPPLVTDVSNITTLSTRQVSGLAQSTQYFWRVKAFNGTVESNWSTARSFTTLAAPVSPPDIPLLVSPAENATNVALPAVLSWNAASNATSYQLQVATTNNFTTPPPLVADVSNITTLSRSVTGLANNTQYFWRVKAFNASGESDWSVTRRFTTASSNGALVAHWEMEDIGGTTLTDASGNGNHATTSGNPTKVTGVYGQALQLNGSNQYATAPSSATLNASSAITLATWIKPASSGSRQMIIKKGTTEDGYELSLTSSGKVAFRYNLESNNIQLNSSATHPTGGQTWMHIAATFDGTTIKMYIDGNLDKSLTLSSPTPINTNSQPLAIGAQSSGSSRFQGAIDDARIYNVALTAAEISNLATMPAARMATTSQPAQPNELEASPNPFLTASKINFTFPETGEFSVILYNNSGYQVRILKQGNANAGEKLSVILDGANLRNGLYLVRLQTDKSSRILKLIRN